jgi:hypothetical protein
MELPPPPPSADFSMLVFLLGATGMMAALAFIFFTVVLSPTVVANSPAPAFKQAQPVITLSPQAKKARMETERAALTKAKEMNAELGLKLGQTAETPASARAEARPKPRRIARTRATAHVASTRSATGENAWPYTPTIQRSFASSWW